MNSVLRHYSVRLWMTAMVAALFGLLLMPWWQAIWGVDRQIVPVMLIVVLVFSGLGWVMNRVGDFFLARQFKEAAVWERAGMIAEAKAAFEQAAALYDSFWLSPSKRKAINQRVGSRVARFHLSRPTLRLDSRFLLAGHLKDSPHDEPVAESWLAHLLGVEPHLPEEYEAAALVGDALQDDPRIQWRLFQFYLNDGRTDFDALKTYQRVWQHNSSIPGDTLGKLARLLLAGTLLNDWSLEVYLRAYESGEPACLEGIAAAARWLPENADNASALASAKNLIGELPRERLAVLTRRFVEHADAVVHSRGLRQGAKRTEALRRMIVTMVGWVRRTVMGCGGLLRGLPGLSLRLVRSRKVWVSAAAGVTLTAAVLVWQPWRPGVEIASTPEPPPPVSAPVAVPTDPFTIQVAAYLKSDDAKRYVQQLKEKGLDAYWTQAASANRVWYQVKVAHFPTRAQAQQYGNQLKSQGLIDDFYVANYDRKDKRD